MMAVLKTGAAYVPIDPAHEASRMEFVLADANPAAVITSADLRSRVDGRDLSFVVDVADPALAAQPATALPAPSADNLAYMIYTSGTTGKPKGVAIAHYTVTWLVESLDAGLPRAGVDAVPFVGVRLLGVGDLRRPAARSPAAGGARRGGGSPEDFHTLLVDEGSAS